MKEHSYKMLVFLQSVFLQNRKHNLNVSAVMQQQKYNPYGHPHQLSKQQAKR